MPLIVAVLSRCLKPLNLWFMSYIRTFKDQFVVAVLSQRLKPLNLWFEPKEKV